MKIVTDLKWKNFKYRHEVPEKVLKDNFFHLGENSTDAFFKYKNCWYHISDFMQTCDISGCKEFKQWHGYANNSFFSGVMIKVSDDQEQYMVGIYYS